MSRKLIFIVALLITQLTYSLPINSYVKDSCKKKDSVLEQTANVTVQENENKTLEKLEDIKNQVHQIQTKLDDKSIFIDLIPILVVLLAGLLALFQVKANIISTARIEWTQNLRLNISSFLSETDILNYNLREVLDLSNQGKTTEAKKLYDEQKENFKKVHNYGNQIILFLNNKEETQQKEFQKLVSDYLNKSTHGKHSQDIDKLQSLQNEIVSKAQDILKRAWEDAKTFKMSDIFKFGI